MKKMSIETPPSSNQNLSTTKENTCIDDHFCNFKAERCDLSGIYKSRQNTDDTQVDRISIKKENLVGTIRSTPVIYSTTAFALLAPMDEKATLLEK